PQLRPSRPATPRKPAAPAGHIRLIRRGQETPRRKPIHRRVSNDLARFAGLYSRHQRKWDNLEAIAGKECISTEGPTMSVLQETRTKSSSGAKRSGRLFVLELSGDRIHSMNPDGTDRKTIVTDCRFPDGIAVDVAAGHIYWTNMGVPPVNDGSIERADL